ncbi:MAG: class I SAM-dependent methyltransferase [Bryobacteraceae bacterium]
MRISPFLAACCLFAQVQPKSVSINAPYVTTPPHVVKAMLDLAGVKKGDVLYDLGCGDGRIVTAAARRGARGVGIDVNPARVQEARENARKAGVTAEFREQDILDADIREATVVTLYLLPQLNLDLRPKLLAELRPGTRVVSHCFDMGDWKPDREIDAGGCKVYEWIVRGPLH